MSRGWICIIEKFRPDLTWGKRFTLGLDTIITGNIDDICSFNKPMGMISDTMESGRVCNGITIANKETCDYVWKIWTTRREWIYNTFTMFDGVPSEMLLLRELFDQGGHCPRLDWIYPNKIFSYKMEIKPININNNSAMLNILSKMPNRDIIEKNGPLQFYNYGK